MTAVYEMVDVQTWKYANECFLDGLSATAVLSYTVQSKQKVQGPTNGMQKSTNQTIYENIWLNSYS